MLLSYPLLTRLLRGFHRYLALFLVPWMLTYAISAITLNHREFFNERFEVGPPVFVKESERVYTGIFAEGAGPRVMAEQILSDLGLDGTYNVQENRKAGFLSIMRADPLTPRRITYTFADKKIVIDREEVRTINLLRRMHQRRGYQHNFLMEDVWSLTIDLSIFAIIFWGLSGVWMWWRQRVNRLWGSICLGAGFALFLAFFLTV